MTRTLLMMVLVLPMVARAAPPGATCQAAKHREAGAYAVCRHVAEAGLALGGSTAKYLAALERCTTKFQRRWTKLEARAVAKGSACPSVGDATAIRSAIVAHTQAMAFALDGGTAPHCADELPFCEASLATCTTDLSASRTAADTAEADLDACQTNLAACQSGQFGPVLSTGQQTCWNAAGTVIDCAGTGQDGDLQRGLPRRYTDNGDGTITDEATGLMWEKQSEDDSIHDRDRFFAWSNAVAGKIAVLNAGAGFAGHTDWRMPNRNELASLVDLRPAAISIPPIFHSNCVDGCTVLTCACTDNGNYWSSTTNPDNPLNAFHVNFINGDIDNLHKNNFFAVRGVRGGS